MSKPIVEIRGISKKIGKRLIIDDLNMDIYPGEVLGLLGPNGAGKTTTIRMMLGLASLTKGEIYIDGYSIKSEFTKAIANVGGIVENPEMYKYMSGRDNLNHYARMHGGISKERFEEVINFIGLENRINDKVRRYSLGMRQRLGVAQAIMHSPKLLVLDEPTNGLDPAGIKELRDKLRELAQKENLAVLVSSHMLSEMELMCDRVAIIQSGRLIDVKTLAEISSYTETDKLQVSFEVSPVEDAAKIISAQIDNGIEIDDKNIIIMLEHDKIPHLVNALVAGGIEIYRIEYAKKSLEAEFLAVTGGNIID